MFIALSMWEIEIPVQQELLGPIVLLLFHYKVCGGKYCTNGMFFLLKLS